MSAPIKPWERAGTNQQNFDSPQRNAMSSSGVPPCCQGGTGPGVAAASRPLPPVPPRPAAQTAGATGYSSPYGYGSGYGGGIGYGGYSGGYSGGMYGGYGGYGYSGLGYGGMNRFGYGSDPGNNSFVRVAEESSRPAFQSIENIVQAVTSVSMMLDSTYQAVYNSFRAVLGVADNFSRMRTQFAQVLSALAIVRTLRYMFRRLLVWLGLRPPGYSEEAWSDAADEAVAASLKKRSRSSWPILMFFGIILGGPWLIWKLVSSVTKSASQEPVEWATGEEDHVIARAEFSFSGQSDEEISFKEGETIVVAPRELQPRVRGWLLGSRDGQKVGYVPADYVKILGKKRGRKYAPSVTTREFTSTDNLSELNVPSENITQNIPEINKKSCCRGSDSPGQVPANESSACQMDSHLDDVFGSGFAESADLPDPVGPAQMEASELLTSQTGD